MPEKLHRIWEILSRLDQKETLTPKNLSEEFREMGSPIKGHLSKKGSALASGVGNSVTIKALNR